MTIIPGPVRLTQFSHGAGCGCKIAPAVLDTILHSNEQFPTHGALIVGNNSRDDAAVYDIGNGQGLIATTDFFMPIVDDPFEFGHIAAANAISDVYAMGGRPIMAIAILGWPVGKLPPETARRVIEGGRSMCGEAGIPLAGGHSIDSPEPIFGLAVNGLVPLEHLKRNDTAEVGNLLFLTKPLGIGILTTAEKKGILRAEDAGRAAAMMMRLNKIGERLGAINGVTAMTDVTGFGLLGHLGEMCMGSGVSAEIMLKDVPVFEGVDYYLERGATPGGTQRNWTSYGHNVGEISERDRALLADPQTSGGLLVAVRSEAVQEVQSVFEEFRLSAFATPIGVLTKQQKPLITIM